MNTDTSLLPFKAMVDFVEQLEEFYGEKHRPLRLYNTLIGKTEIRHKKAMTKHVENMRDFCVENREGITEKNFNKFKIFKLRYSEKVYIDFEQIFNFVEEDKDKDIKEAIQKHFLYMSALLDPTGNAKEILKKKSGVESNFLSDVIDKIEKNVDPNSNPMEAINSIMKSGIFTDMVSSMSEGFESGNLDLGKLMGSVQNMVSELGEKTRGVDSVKKEGDEHGDSESNTEEGSADGKDFKSMDINGLSSMLGNLTEQLGTIPEGSGEDGEMPDIDFGKIMGPMMSGLSSMMGGRNFGDGVGEGPTIPGIGKIPGGEAGINNMMNLVSNMGSSNMSIEEKINQEYEKSKKE